MTSESFEGMVARIVYRSEDTGYTVALVRQPDGSESTLVGTCGAIWDGETVLASGQWIDHPQHGRQFQAESIRCVTPATTEGIKRYLASGMIKGIGEVTAGRIVDRFGTDTLEIIEKQSKKLLDVPGIGKPDLGKDQSLLGRARTCPGHHDFSSGLWHRILTVHADLQGNTEPMPLQS